LASEWYRKWSATTFASDEHVDIVNGIVETKTETTKSKIDKALTAIELLKNDLPKTLRALVKNIENAAEYEKDPSKISKAFTDLAQFVDGLGPVDSGKDKNGNNWFFENFQLNQTINKIGNGQHKRIANIGDQKE
jgi:hypothetical protein